MWLGLMANDSFIWNRYNPNQTVHSLPISEEGIDFTNNNSEYPVFYHNGNLVINPNRTKALCGCVKGEDPL